MDPLCSPLSFLLVLHDPNNGVMKVACLLHTLATAVDNLKDEYNKGMQRTGPYFISYNNTMLKNMMNLAKKDQLFQATAGVERVVVKFVVEQYGLAVHECLAKKNLAPKVLHSENICGGCVVVVIENRGYFSTVAWPYE